MSFAVGYAGAYSTRRSEENWRCDCPLAWPMMTQAASFSIPTNKFNKPFACCSRRRRVGTAFGVVRVFFQQGLSFPRGGAAPGEWKWGELEHHQVIRTLRNPRYAGAYFYGRTKHRKKSRGEAQCVR